MDYNKLQPLKLNEEEVKTVYFIKYSKNKMLNKDITVDMLTYLVGYNLFKSPKKKKGGKKGLIIKLAVAAAILAICIVILAKFMGKKKEKEEYKVINDLSVFSAVNYFGKENIIETLVGRMSRIVHIINKKSKKIINSKLTPSKKNFLLYGEPGTGKTLLVKKLAFILDQNLKLLKLKKNKVKISQLSKSNLLKKTKKMKPCVRLISVQPSSLNDRYVGGTEKNIQKLWDFAIKTKKHEITIIFMDEIDSFFGKRKEENSEHSTNVKSEFLCILDGLRSHLSDRLIFIGATNLPKTLDEAFLRRFHTKILFSKPTPRERQLLIESFLVYNECRFGENEIQKLVSVSDGLTQSQISRIFSDAADFSDNVTYNAEFEDIMNLLENVRLAGNNVEAELAEINVQPRGAEEDYIVYTNTEL